MATNYTTKSALKVDGIVSKQLELPSITSSTTNCFKVHMQMVECLATCAVTLGTTEIPLRPFDLILIQQVDQLIFKATDQPVEIRIFDEWLQVPNPLNMMFVGDNPLIHDLMNAVDSQQNQYIVFRHLETKIVHEYLNIIATLEKYSPDKFLTFQRESLLGLLYTELSRKHHQKVSKTDSFFPQGSIRHAGPDTQAGAIFTYLTQHINDVTLVSAATHFGYQQNYFSRLCQKLFKQSFSKLKTTLRMEMASRMLSLSNKNIDEISNELGYKNLTSFYSHFRNERGRTPRQFREDYQQHIHHP
ncbi:helix-turn-helix transcriptional regulator [Liquorilactobacillus mali]|uniref:helix-turn-helix transcriptional regulator n=1 Tax=Liquorilactobacillus mali TaxID=1618 RepID=UPI002953D24E|nr:AraC family transcriptional regulator [Liquorilactobacillus mali]MDV7757246.1 helix-turn-helix domain-containing protein [Liquorilactobacillus mali]